jgi:poly(A) polymerase
MKTSREIYAWILNSSEFKPSNFTISFFDAIKKKYIDVALLKWKPIDRAVDPGDIPWTRVYFIKWKNEIVWNRETRFCDLTQAIEKDQFLPNQFSIMSFNILSDAYDKNVTNMDKRLPLLTEFITNSNMDIICLQEIVDKVLPELNKTGYLCHKTDTKTNNVVILSKIPPIYYTTISLGGAEKQAIICTYLFEGGVKLNIAGIHLTSDTNRNAKSTRTQQINRILEYLSINSEIGTPTIILGDTNESDRIEQLYSYIDSNNSLEITYDPTNNVLAKKLSTTGAKFRYDRIYTRYLNCQSFHTIINNTISDHYAVKGRYEYIQDQIEQNLTSVLKPTNKTALCILPPYELQRNLPIYNEGWPPHINIFWGFIQEHFFEQYSDHIAKQLSTVDFSNFNITLDQIGSFDHEKKSTIFFEPYDDQTQYIKQIRRIVSKITGFQNEDKAFHLSLESCDKSNVISRKKKYEGINIHFPIFAIYMLSSENLDYMAIKKMITLVKPTRNTFIQNILHFLETFNVKPHLCGSDFFGLSSDDSDIDILCFGTKNRNDFFEELQKPIHQCGLFYKCIVVKNEYTYELKLYSDFITVDLHYVNTCNVSDKYGIASNSLFADPNAVITLVKNVDIFKTCLYYVRTTLKSNKMYGQQYCYLSGIGLAIFTAYVINTYKPKNLDEFKSALQIFDYEQIISLVPVSYARETKSDQYLVILQPTPPYKNTVRTIIRSTKLLLLDCLKNETPTIFLHNKIIFTVTNNYDDEICSRAGLEELVSFTGSIIMRFLLQSEKLNEKNILKPSNDWVFSADKTIATFTILHNCESGTLAYHLERTEKNLREMFRCYNFTIVTQ